VNNAGVASGASLTGTDGDLTAARQLFETNFWGQLQVTNAFTPGLAGRGGGSRSRDRGPRCWDCTSATPTPR
jgi:NADP-dependent 3-hydroxy acid dehydrogenase YdfG